MGLLSPDPHFLCPLSSTEFKPPYILFVLSYNYIELVLPLNRWEDSKETFSKQMGFDVMFWTWASKYTSSDYTVRDKKICII
jgi:hypothetical protein